MKPPVGRSNVMLAVAAVMLLFGLLVDALALHAVQRELASVQGATGYWLARWFVPGICGALGLPLTGLALATGFAAWRQRSDRLWLAEHGIRIVAGPLQVERTLQDMGARNLGSERPYLIVAPWRNPLDGTVHRFASDPILYDPQPWMTGRTQVEVLIDPQAPRRYWMDVDFLPPPQ